MLKNSKKQVYILAMIVVSMIMASSVFAVEKKVSKAKNIKTSHKKIDFPTRDFAQTQLHSIGIGIGQTFLASDYNDYGNSSITADLYYDYSASHSFDMIANLHYAKLKYQNTWTQISGLAIGIKAKAIHYDSMAPFIMGGLGFYLPRVRRVLESELVTSETQLAFGTHFGLGAELKLNNKVKVGLLGHLHNPFDISQETGPEIEGYYFKLLLTSLYTF